MPTTLTLAQHQTPHPTPDDIRQAILACTDRVSIEADTRCLIYAIIFSPILQFQEHPNAPTLVVHNVSPQRAIDIFCAFASGDPNWMGSLNWKRRNPLGCFVTSGRAALLVILIYLSLRAFS